MEASHIHVTIFDTFLSILAGVLAMTYLFLWVRIPVESRPGWGPRPLRYFYLVSKAMIALTGVVLIGSSVRASGSTVTVSISEALFSLLTLSLFTLVLVVLSSLLRLVWDVWNTKLALHLRESNGSRKD